MSGRGHDEHIRTHLVQLGWRHHPNCVHTILPRDAVVLGGVDGVGTRLSCCYLTATGRMFNNKVSKHLLLVLHLNGWWLVRKKHERDCSFTVSHERCGAA